MHEKYSNEVELRTRLRAWRKLIGVPQEIFGRYLGVSGRTVWSWESGEYEPTTKKQLEICELLGITRQRLLFGSMPDESDLKNALLQILKRRS